MKIAIVEDDINMRKSLELALKDEFDIKSFKNPIEALKKLDESFDVIVTDINMPKMDGIEFIQSVKHPYNFVVITGNATLNKAVESLRLGVKDFITKPFEIETLVEAIKNAAKVSEIQHEVEKRVLKERRVGASDKREVKTERRKQGSDKRKLFYGSSPKLKEILSMLKRASATDASILLLGNSGVGKEHFAKFIHQNSPRYAKVFMAINMAAIPENLLESELFGYEKGAFTDATATKKGLFESSNGGTLFLDEIGEMPLALQAKLLRVLQEREITRVGGIIPIKIDVRIISATNANILKHIDDGKFREDLYYRLNTIPIKIPPLKQRKEEIVDIAQEYLKNVSIKYNFKDKTLGKSAIKALLDYDWPGNIRELISVIERAAILCLGSEIQEEDLCLERRKVKKSINSLEIELIEEVLTDNEYNLLLSAKALGITKPALMKKIEKYNIEVE
ncbi:MAG TPA: sigma-54-dependent Fis family transcriptional regulator [Campylobacterales bacterium]|nr:sigma-54-dependent Fis family transcriptional regulator [Campylobacterales bacterium]